MFGNFDSTIGQEKHELKYYLDCQKSFRVVCCLNIYSLVKHFDELKLFIEAETPHIFGINETKLDDTVTDE